MKKERKISEKRLVRTLRELVRIPSFEDDDEIRAYIVDCLANLGIDSRVDSYGNIVSEMSGITKKPTLLLNSHIDTVPPGEGWSTNPFSGAIKNGRIYGRGSCDDKSNVAAMLEIARLLKPKNGRLLLTFAVKEENTPAKEKGSYHLSRYLKANAAIVCESSIYGGDVQIYNGCRGNSNFRITFRGRQAHSGSSSMGVNAIENAARFIHERIISDKIPLHKDGNLIILRISGGLGYNVIPDECVMTLQYRSPPEETEDDIRRLIKRLSLGFDCSINEEYCTRGYEMSPNHNIIKLAKKCVKRRGYMPKVMVNCGGLDSRFFHFKGIPSICVGTGEKGQAHRKDESVGIKPLVDGTEILFEIVKEFFNQKNSINKR